MLELALHVLDILQNTVEAGARHVELKVIEDEPADRLTITVTDDGRGMDDQTVRRVLNPFYTTRTTRHVGLGLPLYAEAAETAGGGLVVRSEPGKGTTVEACFQLSHPDRQPLGDMAATLLSFLLSGQAPELDYCHRVIPDCTGDSRAPLAPVGQTPLALAEHEFTFDTAAIRSELDGVPLNEPLVAQWLGDFIAEGEAELKKPAVFERPGFQTEKDDAQAQIPG